MTDPTPKDGRKRISHPMSLRPSDVLALEYLAQEDRHGNKSLVVRQLIDQRMRSEIGRDWEAVIVAESEPELAEVAS